MSLALHTALLGRWALGASRPGFASLHIVARIHGSGFRAEVVRVLGFKVQG